MFAQNRNVELTKVHYYDVDQSGRNVQIATISRSEPRRHVLENTVIRKNIFGHKWVLKINESKNLKKSKTKLIVYVLVFVCLMTAVCFGIVLSVESKFFKTKLPSTNSTHQVPTLNPNYSIRQDKLDVSATHPTINQNSASKEKENIKVVVNGTVKGQYNEGSTQPNTLCRSCRPSDEICLKILENDKPKCVKIMDAKDPTGCGGLCKIDKEYCKLLDEDERLFQCRPTQNKLKCTGGYFNCGNRCIPGKMRCDGILQCSDQSDERNCDCDLKTHFQCGNSTGCLEHWKKCDGKVDCWDDSDEVNCNRLLLPCPPRIDDADGPQTRDWVRRMFEALCPPSLRFVQVEPILGRSGKYRCAWKVEYQEAEAVSNRKIYRDLESYRPSGCCIFGKWKDNVSGKWIIQYGKLNCPCPPGFFIESKNGEFTEISASSVLGIELE